MPKFYKCNADRTFIVEKNDSSDLHKGTKLCITNRKGSSFTLKSIASTKAGLFEELFFAE